MTETPAVSKSLREVWEWKEAAYREVAHLPRREALSTLLNSAGRAARTMGLDPPALSAPQARMVAEDRGEYRTEH
jgi:hypothetical protein